MSDRRREPGNTEFARIATYASTEDGLVILEIGCLVLGFDPETALQMAERLANDARECLKARKRRFGNSVN